MGGDGGARSCSARCWRRRASRSTTRATCRSSRPRPTEAATLFDLVVGASSIYGGSWLEGAGRGLRREPGAAVDRRPGRPAGRRRWRVRPGRHASATCRRWSRRGTRRARDAGRRDPAAGRSSRAAARRTPRSSTRRAVMDVDVLSVSPSTPTGGMTRRRAARRRWTSAGRRRLRRRRHRRHDELRHRRRHRRASPTSAPSAASGSTSTAPTAARRCARPACAHCFDGVERVDSFIVDPHKWFFAPFDCCALLYREPELARAAHTQTAGVPRHDRRPRRVEPVATTPSTCRAAHAGCRSGSRSPPTARRRTPRRSRRRSTVARCAAEEIRGRDYVELLHEPDLSVVVFRRHRLDAGAVPATGRTA